MLNSMRKSASSLFVKLLFVLLIASFAVWGIGDVLTPSPSSGVIQVGERQININTVNAEFTNLLQQRSQQIGFQLDPEMGLQLGLLEEAINNLASRAMIDNLALELGMRVSDDRVRTYIANDLGLVTETGQFDRQRLANMLANRRITEDQFVEQLRTDIAREDLLRLTAGGVRVPAVLADTLHAYREETRSAGFVRIAANEMAAPEDPADEVLQAYYDENVDAYMAPEYRSADTVLLDPDTLAAEVVVNDELLNEEYLFQKERLYVPETRAIEQMILADAAQAEQAAAALGEGRDFATVAQELAGQAPDAIAMGTFAEDEWFVAEVTDTLFGGEPGAVTEPVETALGWRIYRMAAIEPPHEPTLDEVRDQLTAEIARRIAGDSLSDLAERMQDEVAGGATFAEAAENLGLTVQSFGPVAGDGTDTTGQLTLVPGGDEVTAAAFTEDLGRISNAIDLSDGSVLFIEVTEVIEPAPRPFDSVREQVLDDWTLSRQVEAARALAEELVDAVSGGAALAELAAAHDLTVAEAEGVRRDLENTGGLPRDLAAALFDLAPGAAAMAATTNGEAFFVAVLRAVVPAPDDEDAVALLRLQLSAQQTSDLFEAIGSAMRVRHEPEIQYESIRASFANFYGA